MKNVIFTQMYKKRRHIPADGRQKVWIKPVVPFPTRYKKCYLITEVWKNMVFLSGKKNIKVSNSVMEEKKEMDGGLVQKP